MQHQQHLTDQSEGAPHNSKQHTGLRACLPDTHSRMRRPTPDQQPKAGLQSSSSQHNMVWGMQQQSTPVDQCSEHQWGPGATATAAVKPAASWERRSASIWTKPSPTCQPAGLAAASSGTAAGVPAVLDLSSPGGADSGHWDKPHRTRVGLDLSVHDSHGVPAPWAMGPTTYSQQRQQMELLSEGPVDAAAHATAAAAGGVMKCSTRARSPPGQGLHCQAVLGNEQGHQERRLMLPAAAPHGAEQHAVQAARSGNLSRPQSGSPLAPEAAAALESLTQSTAAAALGLAADSTTPMETDNCQAIAAGAADLGPEAPTLAPKHKRHLMQGNEMACNLVTQQQQQDVSGAWSSAGADSEACERQQDSDDLLSQEMPNLKKLRTRVEGLRVDSSDNLFGLSSPAAADNTGSFIPTHPYSSPRMDQTKKAYPNFDCGSAKGPPSAVRPSQKHSGLSRFAPAAAAAALADSEDVAADGCGNKSQQQQQQGRGRDLEGVDQGTAAAAADVLMHCAASQTAEVGGPADDNDEQWLKHHRELQQLKQQQEALRALLQQAEQQVKPAVSKEGQYLGPEMQAKVTSSAAQGAAATAQAEPSEGSPAGGRTAESDAERVAAQMLAQEGGDWERAMQRMLNLVHSTMQHTNNANPSCSNDRVSQLKRGSSSSSASPLRRSASPKQPSSPHAAAAHFASPYAGSSKAAAGVGVGAGGSTAQRSSPYPTAGPLSAAKLAWPMVPASAVGSPVGSPAACSPMVPSSAVGSPVIAPPGAAAAAVVVADDLAATAGGGSGMVLPSTGWDAAAAAADPAAAATVRYGSPVHGQHGLIPNGCSPCGSLSAAAAGMRSRSPVCGSHGRTRHSARQQSRMAPKPLRTSPTPIGGFGCTGSRTAGELSASAAWPVANSAADSAAAAAGSYSAGAGQLDIAAGDSGTGPASGGLGSSRNAIFAAGALGLSISAAGPGVYTDIAASAAAGGGGGGVSYSQSAAFITDAAAAAATAAAGLSVTAAGPGSQDMSASAAAAAAAAVPTLADVLGIGVTPVSEAQHGYEQYAAAAGAEAAEALSSQQQLEHHDPQADAAAGAAEGAFAAHVDTSTAVTLAQQQQQQAVHTTAAAAAAAFSNVPTLNVDADLDDAAGWLFGENGLLPDTPGPANLVTRHSQGAAAAAAAGLAGAVGGGTQQQQQRLPSSGLGQLHSRDTSPVVAAGADTMIPDHSQAAAAAAGYDHFEQQRQQIMIVPTTAIATAASMQAASLQEPPQQQHCFPSAMHNTEAASQGSQWPADTASGAAVATTGLCSVQQQHPADSWQYDAAAPAAAWQQHYITAAAAVPSDSDDGSAAAMQHYQQQQLGSQAQQDPTATAAAAGGDRAAGSTLGSDQDDIALLQVLLGWATDGA